MAMRGLGRGLLVLMLGACSSTDDDNDTLFGGDAGTGATGGADGADDTTGGQGTTGGMSATTGDDDDDDDDDDATEDGPIFDVGDGGDIPLPSDCPPGEECFCDAVDILFIVDNSGSMQILAQPVIDAFDNFVDDMFSALPPGTDLHVGLTRATGFYDPGNAGGWSADQCLAAVTDGVFFPPTDGDNGVNGQQGRLFEHMGMTYFEVSTDGDPVPLETWFQGALMGTIDGSAPHSNTETVVAGAAYATHPANAMANAGFLRDDAVLVLFLMSDSPDLTPPRIPTSDFVDMVRAAKEPCGGDQCIVTAGAIAGPCYQMMTTNDRLTEFLDGFSKPAAAILPLEGFGGPPPDFEGVLGMALADVISTTCDDIVPEG